MATRLENPEINVKLKLSALWAAILSIYIYADYFGLLIPGHIEEIIDGSMAGFQISDILLLGFMILMTLPSLMIFLSLGLQAKTNRYANIIVGILQLGLVLAGIIDPNIYFVFASSVEAVLLFLVIWYAWKWPLKEA